MTIIPLATSLTANRNAVSLPMYAQRMGLSENAFFGLNNPADIDDACGHIWTQLERDNLEHALTQAQNKIERYLGAPITPLWINNEVHNTNKPMYLRWKFVSSIGKQVVTEIDTVVPDYSTDPATVTITTNDNVDALHIVHPISKKEIHPSSVKTTAGGYIFSVPWARLVDEEKQNNPEAGWDYAVTGIYGVYALEVTVQSITSDNSMGVLIIDNYADCSDTEVTPECIKILDVPTSLIDIKPVVGTIYACGRTTHKASVSYMACTELTDTLIDAVIGLAHSLMANPPCLCDFARNIWEKDTRIPDSMSQLQADCPFGTSAGAWFAWITIMSIYQRRTTLL